MICSYVVYIDDEIMKYQMKRCITASLYSTRCPSYSVRLGIIWSSV